VEREEESKRAWNMEGVDKREDDTYAAVKKRGGGST